MKKTLYNESYYKKNYIDPLYVKLKIANIYYLWLAFFCIVIPARLKRKSKVLDVGCGIGNLVWALRCIGIDAFGIEQSIAAKKNCRIPNYCTYTPYKSLPFKKNSFDLIYTNEVLEHINEKELNNIIVDMNKVNKGKIIHMIGVKERGKMVIEDPTHLTVKNEKWWEKKFNKLGFSVKRGNLFYFFPHIFSSKINKTKVKKGYFFLTLKNINLKQTK